MLSPLQMPTTMRSGELGDHVQENLLVSDSEEVEDWLVKAMGKKLLSGQMDQVKQEVTITKASYRTFGSDDWQHLAKQLANWKVSFWCLRMHGLVFCPKTFATLHSIHIT